MLDLVLSFGLDISIMDIKDSGISDHFPAMFNVSVCNVELNSEGPLRQLHMINSQTTACFSAAFTSSVLYDVNSNKDLLVDELTNLFNSTCFSILDTVAPLKTKRAKLLRQPWVNKTTRTLRRECHCTERKWKKGKLQVYFDILHNCLSNFQKTVKAAESAFLSGIIMNNSHKPRVLFKIFNSMINPDVTTHRVASPALCEHFLKYFTDIISALRAPYLPTLAGQVPASKVFSAV